MNNQYQQPHAQYNAPCGSQQFVDTSPRALWEIEYPIVFTLPFVRVAYQKNMGLVIVNGAGLVNTDNLKLSVIKAYNSLPVYTSDLYDKDLIRLKAIMALLAGEAPNEQIHTEESFLAAQYWATKSSEYLSGCYPANMKENAMAVYKTIAMAAANDTAEKRSKAVFQRTLSMRLIDLLEMKFCLNDALPWVSGTSNPMTDVCVFGGIRVHDRFPRNAEYVLNEPDLGAKARFRFEVKNIDRSSADFALFIALIPESLGKPAIWRLTSHNGDGSEVTLNQSSSISHLLNLVSYIQEDGTLSGQSIGSACFVGYAPTMPTPGGQWHNPQNTYSPEWLNGALNPMRPPMSNSQLPDDCSAVELANGDSPLKWDTIEKHPQSLL